ncbi:DUF6894 family protein [Novosphingobium resinovorum]|uniref:DUF6894 family protein n=1 Tax=Novosphingobium resinovorum TaxID=158500 RepID=UPI002ED0CB45|nr:hypothetical protein [Novosphingobium resinovorum]
MPKYFYHVGDGRARDREGLWLDDLPSARLEAVRFTGHMLDQAAHAGWTGNAWSMQVCDEIGAVLWEISLAITDGAGMRSPA